MVYTAKEQEDGCLIQSAHDPKSNTNESPAATAAAPERTAARLLC